MMGSRWVSKKIPVLSFSVQAFCWKASNSRRGTRRVVVDLCGRLCLVTYTFSRLHRFSSIPFLLLPSRVPVPSPVALNFVLPHVSTAKSDRS